MHGYAVSVGDLCLNTGWMFPDNNIFLELDNLDQPVSLRLSAAAPATPSTPNNDF
jgi:hypothetical protein